MARSKQKCRHCPCPSIGGLRKGQGLCAYHWCVGMYGKAWAEKCHPNHATECKGVKA